MHKQKSFAPNGGDDGTVSDLRRIVRINEEIKTIVATAFQINLMALNAIFLAKRAGQSALGFGVLSDELRRFARDLDRNMTELRSITFGLVAGVTAMMRRRRMERILERADRQSGGCVRAALAAMHSAGTARIERDAEDMKATRRLLQRQLDDTVQLVELGSVLARSARIEAAYGGRYSIPLTQVSAEFDNIIDVTLGSIAALRRQHFTGSVP